VNSSGKAPFSFRHIDLVVSDLSRSFDFYRSVLGLLDWTETMQISGESSETITYLACPQGFAYGALGLRESPFNGGSPSHHRYNIGLHHFAINAESKEKVDQVHDWLKANNATIESSPEHLYSGKYYAVFFRDPDNIKVEVVYRPID
jgi:catechol 2,3-dioxygenase-like lactoylglutathione lyase family enzyme